MKKTLSSILSDVHKPAPALTVSEWCRENVDFSRVMSYETPLRGAYDPDFMPYWKEIQDSVTDPTVREMWIWKPSRAGASENCLLNPLRYTVACAPCSTLYMSADQLLAEDFMDTRIKLGLKCVVECARRLARARSGEHRIYFEDMDLIVRWPRAKSAFKQRGYGLILADEFSMYPDFAPEMLRQRAETYEFAHIIGISSMDPSQRRKSKDDPIFKMFQTGDQRLWMMPDPDSRKLFAFEFGTDKTVHGVKWDKAAKRQDGTWDLDKVKKTAHYVTPSGTVIHEKDRIGLIGKGHWKAQSADALPGIRSYRINAMYLPWRKGDFGTLAAEFLKAKQSGPEQVRIFKYEMLCEEWLENAVITQDDVISKRSGGYPRATDLSDAEPHKKIYIGKAMAKYMTVDVQQSCLWWLAREWIEPGDSGLYDFGYCVTWHEIDDLSARMKIMKVGVDCNYAARRGEVETYCSTGNDIMLQGRDELKNGFLKFTRLPKFPGTPRQTNPAQDPLMLIQFAADSIKTRLWQMINGFGDAKWFVHEHPGHEYTWQMASEDSTDGHWEKKKSNSQNHLWDCEVMQLVLARALGPLIDYSIEIEDM